VIKIAGVSGCGSLLSIEIDSDMLLLRMTL